MEVFYLIYPTKNKPFPYKTRNQYQNQNDKKYIKLLETFYLRKEVKENFLEKDLNVCLSIFYQGLVHCVKMVLLNMQIDLKLLKWKEIYHHFVM